MLKGITENGELKNVKISEDGEILVKTAEVEEKPTEILQTSDKETVLKASILTLSTQNTVVNINANVTNISIANYSETGDITMTIGEKTYQIGSGLAIDFPINENVTSISFASTEADTKTQIVVKGVV